MNSIPIILQNQSEILIRGVDVVAEALRSIKNARFDVKMSSEQESELQEALLYFINDSDPTVVALATNLSRPGKTPDEYSMLRNLLYTQLTDGRALSPFQANVCIFNHDKSIDVSLLHFGIERSMPQTRGDSMYRGLCHYCSRILSGTCLGKGCTLFFNDVAKANSSFIPIVDSRLDSSNATGHGSRLLNIFKQILAEPVSPSEPAALIFIYQTLAYFDFMNSQSQLSTIANFANTSSTRDILAINEINNINTLLSAGRFDKTIDGRHITPQYIYRGQVLDTITTPNINNKGQVIRDIDGDILVLRDGTRYLPTTKKLLDHCNVK